MKVDFKFYILIFCSFVLLVSCTSPDKIYILIGNKADQREKSLAAELSENVLKSTGKLATILEYNGSPYDNGVTYILGTPSSNTIVKQLIDNNQVVLSSDIPGPRGGVWQKILIEGREAILLAGSDFQGMQYAVYDYSKEILKTDLLSYWTGTVQEVDVNRDLYNFEDTVISPPLVPILCYFENDVDELANLKEPLLEYDWESYTQMIDALVHMRYNAIQLFDMLGRPEFFLRPEYKELRPDYNISIDYIEKMIDYAHEKGMMVQIDMAMGYKIKPMEQQYADCWKEHKEKWIDTWEYYLTETPLGKADIFSLRPRNQVWDWEYKSSCGENKIDVFNEVYIELGKIIDNYNPDAYKVVICYHDGMEMFNQGFNPPKDWIVAWSDDGWGGFEYLPDSTKGYEFGTYMHAGFWKNHTVHDPYPEKVDSVMKMMFSEYQATKYCQVNGQQFRPFLLNLEAYSQVANQPDRFDGENFYMEWTQRYFSDQRAKFATKSMKLLHEAQYDHIGYVEHLWEIWEAMAYLTNSPIERPGKTPIPYDVLKVLEDISSVKKRMKILEQSLEIAKKGIDISQESSFYYDHIYLPVLLYYDLLSFETILHDLSLVKHEYEQSNKPPKGLEELLKSARVQLEIIYRHRIEGDKITRWDTWYDPAKRRPNNGFPNMAQLEMVESVLTKMTNQTK